MKSVLRIIVFTSLFIGYAATAQQSQQSPRSVQAPVAIASDPSAPALTLEEKIALITDDVKRQDALEKANAAFQQAIAPINEHQEVAKKAIEAEHPGWQLESSAQGWHLVRKPVAVSEEKK